eukprot:1159519-Pelagomonas_calceolata.AAC.12
MSTHLVQIARGKPAPPQSANFHAISTSGKPATPESTYSSQVASQLHLSQCVPVHSVQVASQASAPGLCSHFRVTFHRFKHAVACPGPLV